jgi:phosphatidate cytidylyltransferase
MSNFKKRFFISLLAFPIIYILLYQKIFSNALIVIVFLFCVYEWNKIFNKKNYIYVLGLLILFFFFLSLIKIYNLQDYNLNFIWLILIAWLTDIGGYIFGKLFGGPKLIKISPNKTWAGVFGSLILSQFAFLIFFFNSDYKLNLNIFFFSVLIIYHWTSW